MVLRSSGLLILPAVSASASRSRRGGRGKEGHQLHVFHRGPSTEHSDGDLETAQSGQNTSKHHWTTRKTVKRSFLLVVKLTNFDTISLTSTRESPMYV